MPHSCIQNRVSTRNKKKKIEVRKRLSWVKHYACNYFMSAKNLPSSQFSYNTNVHEPKVDALIGGTEAMKSHLP